MFSERNTKDLKIVGVLAFSMLVFPFGVVQLVRALEIESATARRIAVAFAFICIVLMLNWALSKAERWRK